jgi:hypothetical protein
MTLFVQRLLIGFLGMLVFIPVAESHLRKTAWCKVVIGLGIAIAVFMADFPGTTDSEQCLFPTFMALPLVYAVTGAIELMTGRPFITYSRKWTQLKLWQHLLIGTLLIASLLGVVIATGTLYLRIVRPDLSKFSSNGITPYRQPGH